MMLKKRNSLRIIKSAKKMQSLSSSIRKSRKQSISFVPTMGALHDGHLSLIRKAKKVGEIVIVSIFINPTQFSEKKDLDNYPKSIKEDIKKLQSLNVDYLFLPNVNEVYNPAFQTKVVVQEFQKHLCGLYRKNHFDGVTTIVLKLFNIVTPNIVVFGKKDLQQFIIIRQMVKELNINIKLICHKTIRERDGLAMSSRNKHLNPQQRELAVAIYKGLKLAKDLFKNSKSISSKRIIQLVRAFYKKSGITKIEYIQIMNPDQMIYPKIPSRKDFIAVALRIGPTRLIDNLEF
ncbi:MAG: pantoate--beta-alanine ligase [Thermodesulfobacteriota bacterium]|nr:pantoate--beta-alanine ligase [Thermodesulfobacteriota bacterium]